MRKLARDAVAVLAIAGGLIGMVWSFHLAPEIQLIISLAVLAVGLLYLLGQFLISRGPEFEILQLEKILTIEDAQGQRATFVRKSKQIANSPNLKEIWFRNIAATGQIEDIKIDGQPAELGVTMFVELGLTSLRKVFSEPLRRGQQFETAVSYTLKDSFPTPTQKLIHVVNYKTGKLRLEVHLPEDRPAKSGTFSEVYGGAEVRDRSDLLQQKTPTILEANVDNLKLGANYVLQWTW